VRNNGRLPASFPVRLTIGTGYTDTRQVTGLAQACAETLEFASWTVAPRCTVAVRCSTGLAGDEYPSNDIATAVSWARYIDVALTEITAPTDTVDSGAVVRPSVRVRNNGTQPATFTATFTIPDEGYLRSSRLTLAPEVSQSVTFATWTPRTLGSHAYRCSLYLANDMDAANDVRDGSTVVQASGIAEAGAGNLLPRLEGPRPSLFRRSVAFGFSLARPGRVELAVYDATGAKVRQLYDGRAELGRHQLVWDGKDEQGRTVNSGAYFCRLQADGLRSVASVLKH
jgi:hypothetical protein